MRSLVACCSELLGFATVSDASSVLRGDRLIFFSGAEQDEEPGQGRSPGATARASAAALPARRLPGSRICGRMFQV
jgi:hypothetical protein